MHHCTSKCSVGQISSYNFEQRLEPLRDLPDAAENKVENIELEMQIPNIFILEKRNSKIVYVRVFFRRC